MDDTARDDFIRRYIAMWHEPDDAKRRALVGSLFAEDAEDFTENAAHRGLEAITLRVKRAHDEWVAGRNHVFRATGNIASHHHVVKFFWEMLPAGGGDVVSVGLDVFVLNDQARIESLYQFIEPSKP